MLKAILFDLDGTLLPMEQDLFLKDYFECLVQKMAVHGYEPERLTQSIWACTEAMVQNNGQLNNEEVFWEKFANIYGDNARRAEPTFRDFYLNEFQAIRHSCGFNACAADSIQKLKEQGYRLILATNPLFPAIATHSRIRWAGLTPDDFEWITTYENSSFCKPNPDYYWEILKRIKLQPEECLMVGNDVTEDMIAEKIGLRVFLLTDCLINKKQLAIDIFPHGSFPELLKFIGSV